MSDDVIGELLVNVALDGSNFQRGVQNINQQLRLVQSDFRATGSKLASFGNTTRDLETKIESLTKQIGLQNQKSELYREQIDKTITKINKYKTEQEQLATQISNTKKALEESILLNGKEATATKELQNKVNDLGLAFDRKDNAIQASTRSLAGYQIKLNNTKDDIKKLEDELSSVNRAFVSQTSRTDILAKRMNNLGEIYQRNGDKLKAVGSSMTIGITAPIVAGLGYAIKSAAEFDKQMQAMRALLDDGSASADTLTQQIQTLGDKSKEWAARYGVSITSVNEGITKLIKRGYTYNQVIGAMPSILDASRASGDDFNTVMHVASSILEQFGLKANDTKTTLKNTQMVTDELTYAANKTAAGFSDMGVAMEYVGPVAHAAGYSLNVIAAAIGLLSNRGIEADKAGTSLRAMITKLVKPTKEAKAALNEMGVQVVGANGKLKPLGTIIDDINEKTKNWSIASRNAALVQIFGRQSLAGVVALISQGGDALDKLSKETLKSTGYTKKLSDQMGKTSENQLKQLTIGLQVLGQEIGHELIPEILPLVHDLTDLTKAFGDLSPETKKLIVDSALILAALGPLNFTLGTVIKSVGLLRSGVGNTLDFLSKFRTEAAITATATEALGVEATVAAGGMAAAETSVGLLGGALTVLTGPVGIAIAAIAALGVGIYAFSRSNDKLQKVSLDTANSMIAQHDANTKLIDSFDALRNKCSLTNDELGRYMDLQDLIKKETNPKQIAVLKDEMNHLQIKSGLSNDQLQKMIDLNDKLTKKLPASTNEITTQGNRIAGTTEEMKKYNDEFSKATVLELEEQYQKSLVNQNELMKQKTILQQQLNIGVKQEKDLLNIVKNYNKEAVKDAIAKHKANLENLDFLMKAGNLRGEDRKAVADAINKEHDIIDALKGGKQKLVEQLDVLHQQNDTIQKKLNKNKEELLKDEAIKQKLEEQLLVQGGINQAVADQSIQQGTIDDLVDNTIARLKTQKQVLIDQTPPAQRTNKEFLNAVSAIDGQINKLKAAKGEIDKMTTAAKGYNSVLGSDIKKQVKVDINWSGMTPQERYYAEHQMNAWQMRGFAEGTDNAPPGWAWVGEKGPELRWFNGGEKVIPHDKSMQIAKQWNLPMFANGADIIKSGLALVGERGKELYRQSAIGVPLTNGSNAMQPQVIQVIQQGPQKVILQINDHEATGIIHYITDEQVKLQERENQFKGE